MKPFSDKLYLLLKDLYMFQIQTGLLYVLSEHSFQVEALTLLTR